MRRSLRGRQPAFTNGKAPETHDRLERLIVWERGLLLDVADSARKPMAAQRRPCPGLSSLASALI